MPHGIVPPVSMNVPRVSVLMAVHNEERFLAAAIESVLAQTFADFELIVVDDASTDRSRAIASSSDDPRIRLVANAEQLGQTRSLNRGLALCRGEYVARLDGNDLAFPGRLAKQVAWLDAHPDIGVLGTQAAAIDVHGRRIRRASWWNAAWRKPSDGLELEWYRAFDTPFLHSAVLFRRALVERLGGYDERHDLAQDAELWMRAAAHAGLANLDEPLIAFRFDRGSMTADASRPERVRYPAMKTPVIQQLFRDVLRWPDIPARWAELWVAANVPGPAIAPADVPELAAALDACAERFFALHPEARHLRGIARHRASMLGRLAAAADRRTMLALYARMFRLDFSAALWLLPRLAALFLLGDAAIRWWRRGTA
jgi:glycosyltransferase involved in cell wall biosynthesis